ncbi:hypothetical protein CRENPOLYSF2_3310001 [Crenothrix polyspora]|uniref:Uncharacterized protein n=1 Tax=Crenothrix polyspora TaxID=360316 RepID=A0A1R4HB97_9GAMM|nr:hypothetical protein CRENPOLYSF2_3310001 [Crenothrix polyspora]
MEERAGNALPSKALDAFAKKISALQPQSNATFYAASRVNVCAAPPKFGAAPQIVVIAKSDGSIACGTQGISLAQMRKELGHIKVFSALKKSDGKIRPAVCGIATGRFNVYVIDKSGLLNATEHGFSLWSSLVD